MSRARLSLRESNKPALVAKARDKIAAVKQNANYPSEPEIQACVTELEAATDALDKTNRRLDQIRGEEVALLASQGLQVADLKRATQVLLAVVNHRTRGSEQGIRGWGFEVASAAVPIVDAPPPPDGLRVTIDRQLRQVVRWGAVSGHRGYILQLGDESAKNWRTPIQVTRASYPLTELKPGERASVRVAVRRASGESAFSEAIGFLAR